MSAKKELVNVRLTEKLLPKVITFDAYNTLYATKLPVFEQYCLVGKKYGIDCDPHKLTLSFPQKFKELKAVHPEYGKFTGISAYEWWAILIKTMFAPIIISQEMVQEILDRFDGKEAYQTFSDVLELLELIKTEYPDIILGIASNTDPLVYNLLRNLELDQFFTDHIYLSYDLGLKKPDTKFFDTILQSIIKQHPHLIENMTLEDLKARCWHIGDEEINDMKGAEQAGWNGVLVDRIDKYKLISSACREIPRDEHLLSLDKVDANFDKIWKASLQHNSLIQMSETTYASTNLNTLRKYFFGK